MRPVLWLTAGVLALTACEQRPKDPLFMNIDIVCSMNEPYGEGRRYSLDLERRVWCATGPTCAATTRPIVSADQNAVVLMSGADSLKLDHATVTIEGVEAGRRVQGPCTRTPFTPMG